MPPDLLIRTEAGLRRATMDEIRAVLLSTAPVVQGQPVLRLVTRDTGPVQVGAPLCWECLVADEELDVPHYLGEACVRCGERTTRRYRGTAS